LGVWVVVLVVCVCVGVEGVVLCQCVCERPVDLFTETEGKGVATVRCVRYNT